ncbi:MAG: TonB-dependent receptor [Bacteroidetes bacterium]|nr:TonB-dependent receptor [Bacteroidota bacterium]MBU1485643.1 TonB-dependent receptor [Bacteroidota bacterium]MBU2266610.1 TonB-dependent receptor [Bacteroidota bacterium]MBU2376950.1 TonB-dependent receptor [Bacteroidota bacterium]
MVRVFFSFCFRNIILFLVFVLVCSKTSLAQSPLLDTKISLQLNKTTIDKAIEILQKRTGISFAFDPSTIPQKKIQSKNFTNQKVETILSYILNNTHLIYKEVANSIVITPASEAQHTINGIIYDEESGENLIGATLQIDHVKEQSNSYGYYSITIPEGSHVLTASYIGYDFKRTQIILNKDQYLSIALKKSPFQLAEINVASQTETDSTEMMKSAKSISITKLKKTPYFGGEVDVLKALQMQVGIKNQSEGSAGLSVRGGNLDQNLLLIDEAPVYNPTHLFGLVSVYNIDAIKSVQLYKDYIPANFGGRLSSVIDTKLDEGSLSEFHIKGGASLLSARIAVEGPIVKDTSSFLFAFRRSLTDIYNNNFRFFNINANYYDFNLKTNYIFNKKNRVYFSIYKGIDHLFSDNNYANNWSNTTSTLRFNHIFNPKLFVNFSAIYSNYTNTIGLTTLGINSNWLTGIQDVQLKGDFTFYHKPENTIQFGISGVRHHIRPGETDQSSASFGLPKFNANEFILYFNQKLQLTSPFQLNYGLRLDYFDVKEDAIQNHISKPNELFINLEPRFQLAYQFRPHQILKFSYMRNVQNLQFIQNNELSYTSLETWIPSHSKIKPQIADVLSINYNFYQKNKNLLGLSLYYKKMSHQVDLIDHSQILLNPLFENDLRFGDANAYGIEFNWAKSIGKISGDLSYSYSRTFRKINGINNNLKYPALYDIPNDLKLNISYQISQRLTFSSFFNYSTGRPITLPTGFYTDNGQKIPIYEGRNNSRFPNFNRLDIIAELKPKIKINDTLNKRWKSTWTFGVYNVYGRRNPLFYRLSQNLTNRNLGFEESFSGIVPTVSYSFKY